MKQRRVLVFALVAAFLVIVTGLPALLSLAVDWYWFSGIEYQVVFLTELWTKVLLGVIVGALAFGFFFVNLRMAQRGLVPDPMVVGVVGPIAFVLAGFLMALLYVLVSLSGLMIRRSL